MHSHQTFRCSLGALLLSIFTGCSNAQKQFVSSSEPSKPSLNFSENMADNAQIYGGQLVSFSDPVAMHTVGIIISARDNSSSSTCSGTLVTEDTVLTAAHCVEGDIGQIGVFFDRKIEGSRRYILASDFVIHPQYKNDVSLANNPDLALIKLSKPAPEGFVPASILIDQRDLKDGTNLIAAGYGVSLVAFGGLGSGRLRKLKIGVLDAAPNQSNFAIDNKFFKGICVGDSGGPLFIEKNNELVVAGVISAVAGIPYLQKCGLFAIAVKPGFFVDWLYEGVSELKIRSVKRLLQR